MIPAMIEPSSTELPCNVFGTVDRCDGMSCEHDGHCFSGCCSLFVSGDQKRCMPLVGGDMCPIAIDVVEKFQIISEPAAIDEESPLHYIGNHKEIGEDLPIIEKTEHHEGVEIMEQNADHVIPEKREHHALDDEEDYENAEHYIPAKSEF